MTRRASILTDILSLLLFPFERKGMSADEAARFYKSREWAQTRYEAIKRHGRKCMACGATERIVVDHIKPVRTHRGLRLTMSNLQILCRACNRGKGSRCTKDWR